MIHPSDERIRNMAKPEGIAAWYRGSRHPKDVCPRGDYRYDHPQMWQRFDEIDYETVREQQRLKAGVRDGVDFYSNLKGPHNVSGREDWFAKCRTYRTIASSGTDDRADWIERHRRTITAIRTLRFCTPQRMAGVSPRSFYYDPNNFHVCYEEVAKAEAEGIVWTRLSGTMPTGLFTRLTLRLRKTGRMARFWSSHDDPDEIDSQITNYVLLFSDPEDAEKVTEELVWLKLRY